MIDAALLHVLEHADDGEERDLAGKAWLEPAADRALAGPEGARHRLVDEHGRRVRVSTLERPALDPRIPIASTYP